jgi:ribosomal protein S30
MAALYTQTLMTPIWHQQTPKLPAKQNIQHNKQPKKYIALNTTALTVKVK